MESYFSDKFRLSAKREDDVKEKLPTELSTLDNSDRFVTVFGDKLSVKYSGLGLHDEDVGVVQANRPAPINRCAYYFEIHVKNAGDSGKIAIGFSRRHIKMSGLKVDSCSYHGLNGHIYRRRGQDETQDTTSPAYTTNDTVGCGINYASQEFFFTKNEDLVWKNKVFTGPLYPTVYLHSQNEDCFDVSSTVVPYAFVLNRGRVTVNFGPEGFAFDFEGYKASVRNKQRMEIEKIYISPSITHGLVKDYLLHYGYEDTLKAFVTESAVPPTYGIAQEESYALNDRKHLRELIMKGEIDAARDKLKEKYPQLVQDDKSEICFLLGCQKFIELVRKKEIEEAVKYGREELAKFIGITSFKDVLEECIALLVYASPEESVVGYFLGEVQKKIVGDVVNAGILSTNPNKKDELRFSRMERLLRQLTSCTRELYKHH